MSQKVIMVLKYLLNNKKGKENRIKLLGTKFVENNINNCSLIINEKEYPISEYFTLKKNEIKDNEL